MLLVFLVLNLSHEHGENSYSLYQMLYVGMVYYMDYLSSFDTLNHRLHGGT